MRLAELTVPAEPEYVSVARLVVASVIGDRYELDDDHFDDLKLATSEALNACISGLADVSDGAITLTCEGDEDSFTVAVGGPGLVLDEDALTGDSLPAEGNTQALGLPLIASLVDSLSVETEEHPRLVFTMSTDPVDYDEVE